MTSKVSREHAIGRSRLGGSTRHPLRLPVPESFVHGDLTERIQFRQCLPA